MDAAATEPTRVMFYKTRTSTRLLTDVLRKEFENSRRDSRLTLMLKKRNIDKFMSPIYSPVPIVKEKPVLIDESKRRHNKLLKYKQEKQKKIEEQKAKAKPVFKVPHVKHSPVTDYSKMFKQIKGKDIKPQNKKDSFKLAPSSTYKFKPPINIKPISMAMSESNGKSKLKKKLDFDINPSVTTLKNRPKVNRHTSDAISINGKKGLTNNLDLKKKSNSRALGTKTDVFGSIVESVDKKLEVKITNNVDYKSKCTPVRRSERNCSGSARRTAMPTESSESLTKSTPARNASTKSVVISPFVTISRGKDNASREYRKRLTNCDLQSDQSPVPDVAYFSNLLAKETQRLSGLCEEWRIYEDEVKPPEEACDMIHVAIGQTELLLRKKFKKFAELIDMCGSNKAVQKVTYFDLHGFWDIVLMQINNLDHRFNNLTQLKTNNWEEILPPPVVKKSKRILKVKKPEVKSTIKDIIREARKKKLKGIEHSSPSVKLTTTRGLVNISNVFSNEKTPTNSTKKNTPKSILKTDKKRSSLRKSKSVLFVDDIDKENVFDSTNLITFTPSPRRSKRLIGRRINEELTKS